jgi:GNAT superfamily N-acetyltransferase
MALEFTVDPELTDGLQAEIVACWTDVTNAGGSVGFVPPVAMDDVLPVAVRSLAAVAAGHDRLVIGREREAKHAIAGSAGGEIGGATGNGTRNGTGGGTGSETGSAAEGRLAALAFITSEQSQLTDHWRNVKKVMVHPDFQGRGYGTLLMAEIERVGRAMGWHLLTLDCRGGTGNDEFYKKCGYVEYGRLPGALKIGPDEYRDRILMTLSLRG